MDLLDWPDSGVPLDIEEAEQKRIREALLIITVLIKEEKADAEAKAHREQDAARARRAAKKVSKARRQHNAYLRFTLEQ